MLGLQFKALFVTVGLEDSLNDSILGDVAEGARKHLWIYGSFFFEGMVVRARSFFASVCLTSYCFVI